MTADALSRVKSCLLLEEQQNWKAKRALSLLGRSSSSSLSPELELECTSLLLHPHQEDVDENDDSSHAENRLYLPRRESAPQLSLDEYLCHIPQVASRAQLPDLPKELLEPSSSHSTPHEPLQPDKAVRCLNVLQGEVAHASASQADLVVSAEATTCHVVALRSTCRECNESSPLVSLAHVDKARVYNASLEAMVQKHILHHHEHEKGCRSGDGKSDRYPSQENEEDDFGFYIDDDDGQKDVEATMENTEEEQFKAFLPELSLSHRKSVSMPSLATSTQRIDIALHLVGGYMDKGGVSQELSTSLITTFSQLADKYRDHIRITLTTAAISCMNTVVEPSTDAGSPMKPTPDCRGLGIDTRTGQVFAVRTTLPAHLEGPAVDIRSARVWAQAVANQRVSRKRGNSAPVEETLYVIHDTTSEQGQVRVAPFTYERNKNLSVLLKLPDEQLLQYTSTSPECESDLFCTNIRRVVSFLNHVPPETVFGSDCTKSLVYSRSTGNLNEWETVG